MAGSQRGVNGDWHVLAKPGMPTRGAQWALRCIDITSYVVPLMVRHRGLPEAARVAVFNTGRFSIALRSYAIVQERMLCSYRPTAQFSMKHEPRGPEMWPSGWRLRKGRGWVVEHGYAMGSGRGFLWRNVIMTACLARGPYRKREGVIANNSSFEWIPSFL